MIILLFYIFIGWPVKYTVKAKNDPGPNQTIFCQSGRSYRVNANDLWVKPDDLGRKHTILFLNVAFEFNNRIVKASWVKGQIE